MEERDRTRAAKLQTCIECSNFHMLAADWLNLNDNLEPCSDGAPMCFRCVIIEQAWQRKEPPHAR